MIGHLCAESKPRFACTAQGARPIVDPDREVDRDRRSSTLGAELPQNLQWPQAAARMFEAYGVTPNGDDPMSTAIRGLVDHATAQEQQIDTIISILKKAGLCCDSLPEMDKFDPEQLNKLVE